jgi:hypothetical protein
MTMPHASQSGGTACCRSPINPRPRFPATREGTHVAVPNTLPLRASIPISLSSFAFYCSHPKAKTPLPCALWAKSPAQPWRLRRLYTGVIACTRVCTRVENSQSPMFMRSVPGVPGLKGVGGTCHRFGTSAPPHSRQFAFICGQNPASLPIPWSKSPPPPQWPRQKLYRSKNENR